MPFGEELDDPFEIHEVILRSRNLKYPHLNDQNTKLFIEVLLNKVPVNRLCCGYYNLKEHKFFDGFDWVLYYIKFNLRKS